MLHPNQQTNCALCKRDIPHEKHLTLLEYLRLFGEMETYGDHRPVLAQSSDHVVASGSAKQRIA